MIVSQFIASNSLAHPLTFPTPNSIDKGYRTQNRLLKNVYLKKKKKKLKNEN